MIKLSDYDILTPIGEIIRLTKGTRIIDIEVIAGKGKNRRIDIADILVDEFGGEPDEWRKMKGFGYVDINGESYKAELHWYEEPSVGKVEWKIKPGKGGNWLYDED